jgi:hypothetical protein
MSKNWLQATSELREQFLFSATLLESVKRACNALAVAPMQWKMIPGSAARHLQQDTIIVTLKEGRAAESISKSAARDGQVRGDIAAMLAAARTPSRPKAAA